MRDIISGLSVIVMSICAINIGLATLLFVDKSWKRLRNKSPFHRYIPAYIETSDKKAW